MNVRQCPDCKGKGRQWIYWQPAVPAFVQVGCGAGDTEPDWYDCPKCDGTGKVDNNRRRIGK